MICAGTLKGVIAGAKLTKTSAYQDLADFVTNRCNIRWDWKTAMSRFRAYIKLYQETKKKVEDNSGEKFTLTETDFKKNITTIKDKVEIECEFYYRLDALFGHRQNIKPTSVLQPSTYAESQAEILEFMNEDDAAMSETDFFESNHDNQDYEQTIEEQVDSDSEAEIIVQSSQVNSSLSSTSKSSAKVPEIDKRASNTVLKHKIKEISKDEASVSKMKVALENKSASKDKSFFSMMNEVKSRDLEFQIRKYEEEKEFKREEMEYKRRKMDNTSSSSRKDIIETLIKEGKTPDEIKSYMEVIASFL